jgi:hypothetical protein
MGADRQSRGMPKAAAGEVVHSCAMPLGAALPGFLAFEFK